LIRPSAILRNEAKIIGLRPIALADGETSMTAANDMAIRRALEAAGVNSSTRMAAALGCA